MKLSSSSCNILAFSLFIFIFSIALIGLSLIPKKRIVIKESNNCTTYCGPEFFIQQQSYINQSLQSKDPQEIYADLKQKFSNSPATTQHGIAHIFGEELFKNKGLQSITTCDDSFAFGCYHGFLYLAISSEGIETVPALDKMCTDKYGTYSLGCQHGLGHGIAEYYGPQNLNLSLDVCSKLAWKHRLMGCSGGVFMEFLMPTLTGNNPGSVEISPLDESAPYSPCDQIDDFYKPECFYNLGNYYYHAKQKNVKESLSLCENISEELYKKTCILGLGNSIYSNLRNIEETITSCSQTSNINSQLYCRSGAAWLLYTDPQTRAQSKDFCLDLDPQEEKSCRDDINLLEIALTY